MGKLPSKIQMTYKQIETHCLGKSNTGHLNVRKVNKHFFPPFLLSRMSLTTKMCKNLLTWIWWLQRPCACIPLHSGMCFASVFHRVSHYLNMIEISVWKPDSWFPCKQQYSSGTCERLCVAQWKASSLSNAKFQSLLARSPFHHSSGPWNQGIWSIWSRMNFECHLAFLYCAPGFSNSGV